MLPNRLSAESLGGAFAELKKAVDGGARCIVTGAAKNARRHIACTCGRFVLYVAPDRVQAAEAREILADYYGGRVVLIPAHRATVVKYKLNFSESAAMRAGALADILTGEAVAATISAESLLDWFPDAELFKRSIKKLKKGDEIAPEVLEDILTDGGYKRTSSPEKVGEFSRRGDVMDIWTGSSDLPARIEFFGDEIESVRLFAPDTMLSVRETDELTVSPRSDILCGKAQRIQGIGRDHRGTIGKIGFGSHRPGAGMVGPFLGRTRDGVRLYSCRGRDSFRRSRGDIR